MAMKTYTPEELKEILNAHWKWLKGEEGGSRAKLSWADLSGANLSRAVERYAKVSSLHRRILAAIDAGGKLNMGYWHTCETTHCRAGWAIHLAGPAGEMLEACMGPVVAGALIHIASCPQLEGKVPDFYNQDNEAVLDDIKRLAALEPELEAPCSP